MDTIEVGTFALDEATRTARGLLIPYDEPTDPRHKHPAVFRKGRITIPSDWRVLRANRDHDLLDPVAVFSHVEDTDRGVEVVFDIAKTPEGDDLIEQHKRGERTHLSGEFRNLVKRGAEVVSGVLTGAAFVDKGAFASAGLFSFDPITEEAEPQTTDPSPEAPATPESPEPTKEESVSDDIATVPGTIQTPASNIQAISNEPLDKDGLFALITKAKDYNDRDAISELKKLDERSIFALSDVKISGANTVGVNAVQGGWLGQLWAGRRYERTIVPLLVHGDLKKLSYTAWKWNVKPAMATWAGNKAAITSNAPSTSPVTSTAQRFAGGHDLAREFYDFNETEVIEAYGEAMVDSYAALSDNYTLDALIAGATAVDAATYPTDVPDVLGKLVQGALAVINGGGNPTFAVLSQALFAEYIYTMRDNTLEFLATSATLEDGRLAGMAIVPDPTGSLTADQVLVGDRRAANVLELPGSPVKVSALDLVNGGVDNAFFGYIGVPIHRPEALSLVSDGE